MSDLETRIGQLYAAHLAQTDDIQAAAGLTFDCMLAAPAGPWRAALVRLPADLRHQLLVWVEAIDATLAKRQRLERQGLVRPLPGAEQRQLFDMWPPHEAALKLATSIHAGRRLQIGEVLRVYRLWKRLTGLPYYRAGDPSFLARTVA
jgi:hypothetical protein